MERMLAVLMTASLTMAACDGGVSQSVSSPSPTPQARASTTDNTVFAVGGVVQSIEKPTRAIGGARIEIVQGANAGKFALSDDTGAFAIYGLTPGAATIQVSKSGYQAWASKNFDIEIDTKIAVELFPAPPANSSGASATGRCNDGGWTWATSQGEACMNDGGLAYGVCPGPFCKSGA
jgi:hypothetical protein